MCVVSMCLCYTPSVAAHHVAVDDSALCCLAGVMHRDIKPENFLLTDRSEQAVIKAADFGLCTYFQPGQRFRHIVGSAYYVAPEVLQKNYSYEADMWSLGVVLYILLCGLPPFWGDTGRRNCTHRNQEP